MSSFLAAGGRAAATIAASGASTAAARTCWPRLIFRADRWASASSSALISSRRSRQLTTTPAAASDEVILSRRRLLGPPVHSTCHIGTRPLLSASSRHLSFGKKDDEDGKDKSGLPDGGVESGLGRRPGETRGQAFKRLARDYWYVLIPVHLVTSTVWIGSFYLMVKSGVDIAAVLEKFGTSPQYIEKISKSEWANLALAYACYKIATPARYTVTLVGTVSSVKYLREWGYLRTSSDLKESLKDRREDLKERVEEVKDRWEEEWERSWLRWAKKNDGKKKNRGGDGGGGQGDR